jgi:UDP-glucosyl transferase 73C
MEPFPTCIICDKNIISLAETLNKLKIPRIIFDGTNCFNILCNHNIHASKICETLSESDEFVVPGLPHRIVMRKSQLPKIFKPNPNKNMNFIREKLRVEFYMKIMHMG